MSANERTFQGELYRIINGILITADDIRFSKITQEENVGVKGQPRFADGKLYSKDDIRKIVLFELKNSKWDATDDVLVTDAAMKAMQNGYHYFVTGTPRQLAIYETFREGVSLQDRKVKITTISNIKKDDEVLLTNYEREITPKIRQFLIDLSALVHGERELHWDSIDRVFVNKLSAYILEASAEMFGPMRKRITASKRFQERLREYLRSQEIFNVSLSFGDDDIYNLCQLANYLLFLKIIFYSYLERDCAGLALRPIEIPEDIKLLNSTLRARFDDVLEHDYEQIFNPTILDEFEFEPRYRSALADNVEEIRHLDFSQLNADIIGSIYNTLIDNQEQHDRGQHFTNTNEVDIVNAFCIKPDTHLVLDSACGAGTFLVRAYYFLKRHHENLNHQQLLERVWGIEIAPFPAFLAVMNLSLLDIKTLDNYPVVIQSDFAKIDGQSTFNGYFLNANRDFDVTGLDGRKSTVRIPTFDACVGNPPYIRQELIEDKSIWNQLVRREFGVQKVNQQSDLFVYYLIHTAAFLKDGGRIGYVISTSWLDGTFGAGLQKFLLDHFKIIAIMEHQTTRSFETALVNTVILIAERCNDSADRLQNLVKFVRVFGDYERIIGRSSDADRFERVVDFADYIENAKTRSRSNDIQIDVCSQDQLEKESTYRGNYSNGYWGAKYLRSPKIYQRIVANASTYFVPLEEVADIKYGVKSGANEFFYLIDETNRAASMSDSEYRLVFGISKTKHDAFWATFGWFRSELDGNHYVIEREFVRPLFKSQKEAIKLGIDPSKLKYVMLYCDKEKEVLRRQGRSVLKYIEVGESRKFEIHKRPSVAGRRLWYDLTGIATVGDFIFPSKIGERFRLIDNQSSKVFCDKVCYVVSVKAKYRDQRHLIFTLLNGTIFRYFVDLFSRQMVVKVSDVDVNLVKRTLIVRPELLESHRKRLEAIAESLRSREQQTIFDECLMPDRIELDQICLSLIGLKDDMVELHQEACSYVRSRKQKADSLVTTKSKKRVDYVGSLDLARERFPEIRRYKDLVRGWQVRKVRIPNAKTKYPPKGLGNRNLFDEYTIEFSDGNRVLFDHPNQLELVAYLNATLDVCGDVFVPILTEDCENLLISLIGDFESHFEQLKAYLRSIRSAANATSIYRDLVFSK